MATKTTSLFALLSLVMLQGCLVLDGPEPTAAPADAPAGSKPTAHADPARPEQPTQRQLVAAGEDIYAGNCTSCHTTGMAGAPNLTGVVDRLNRQQFVDTLDEGPGAMPSWSHLSLRKKRALWTFLGSSAAEESGLLEQREAAGGGCGCGRKAGSGGGCGCGGGSGSCGSAGAKPHAQNDTPGADRGSGGGGCGCGR